MSVMVAEHRLLVVEDEQPILDALLRLFRHAGFEAMGVRTATEALDGLRETSPSLVVLDLVLPDLDGFEVCRSIRRQLPYIPVVMLTARRGLEEKLVGLEVGADAYLAKPFEPRELVAQVRALLRLVAQGEARQQGLPAAPITFGPLRVWTDEHRVEVDGEPRELAPKEFKLLCLLLQHPGKVFGRESLLRQVWGYDFLGDSRTVDVHVQRLRSHIEPEPSAPQLIRTVRGFGYRLAQSNELAGGIPREANGTSLHARI